MFAAVLGAEEEPDWVRRLDELHLLTPLRVLLIIVVAMLITKLVSRFVSRSLSRIIGRGATHPRAEVRRKALASAMRGALIGIVWTTAVITIVGEVGINIGAFVATATVVGGAVAFGAQTMVRDVIAGFFVLAEDQYGVGDDVDLGLASGNVEKITLRSVKLRDGEGKVWYVPHGNVQRVANSSKASAAWLDLQIDRGSDVNAALAVAAALGEQLRHDPIVGASLASDPVVVGVTDVRDDRFVVRVSAPTLPNQGDAVRRAWRLLALAAFARGDLTAPSAPTTVVHLTGVPEPPAIG
jgi:small conductance mechanosensitive channel